MTKRVNLLTNVGRGGGLDPLTPSGNPWSLADGLADELVNRRVAEYTDPVSSNARPRLVAGMFNHGIALVGNSRGGSYQISTGKFSAGVYMVRLFYHGKVAETRKLVLER